MSVLSQSILDSVKLGLGGLTSEYDAFDEEIITDINSVFFKLHQLDIGPDEPYYIEDRTSVWSHFDSNAGKILAVKTYLTAEVRLMFDPPTSPAVKESLSRVRDEYEWRLMNSKYKG